MNATEYVLANSGLPFDLSPHDPEAITLLGAPALEPLFAAVGNATDHQREVEALDAVADWVRANWRRVLPGLAERFPRFQVEVVRDIVGTSYAVVDTAKPRFRDGHFNSLGCWPYRDDAQSVADDANRVGH
jgi:hypothetical protein